MFVAANEEDTSVTNTASAATEPAAPAEDPAPMDTAAAGETPVPEAQPTATGDATVTGDAATGDVDSDPLDTLASAAVTAASKTEPEVKVSY